MAKAEDYRKRAAVLGKRMRPDPAEDAVGPDAQSSDRHGRQRAGLYLAILTMELGRTVQLLRIEPNGAYHETYFDGLRDGGRDWPPHGAAASASGR
jgi:hypothetical protein